MAATNKFKYSKNGWPLSAVEHNLGEIFAPRCLADALIEKLNSRYEVGAKLKETVTDNYYRIVTEPKRLSIETFLTSRAYINGYKDGVL